MGAYPAEAAASAISGVPAKPNFIVILLDDSGFADLGCYGGIIPTPNIDNLARNGVRMSGMYNCARSCPTRASLLTGLYPQQAGIGHMVGGSAKDAGPSYQGYLNKNCVTLGEVMRAGGYFTAMSGKWHVGQKQGVTPWKRGFDRSINAVAGGFYYAKDPKAEIYLDGELLKNDDPRLPGDNWYTTDVWTQYANTFINEAVDKEKPFMLYLAYNAPHFPLQAPKEAIAMFKGKFAMGWDRMRQEIYQRQLKINLLGKRYPLTPPSPLIPRWSDVDDAQKAQSEHTMEIYAAMLYYLDKCVGQVVDNLKAKGVFDNTVIILLSDNGGNAEGKTVFGTFEGKYPGRPGSEVFLGQAWAESCNTPFFLYKHHTHEGGIATPLVVSYPAGIPSALNGLIVDQPAHVIDIMATMVAMSGAEYPSEFQGNKITPMQGINLYPLWAGGKAVRTDPIFWEHEDNVAIRYGKWKLVKERNEEKYQLYDMEADRTEMNDLSGQQPQVMADMMKRFRDMYKKVGAAYHDFGKAPRWFTPVSDYKK